MALPLPWYPCRLPLITRLPPPGGVVARVVSPIAVILPDEIQVEAAPVLTRLPRARALVASIMVSMAEGLNEDLAPLLTRIPRTTVWRLPTATYVVSQLPEADKTEEGFVWINRLQKKTVFGSSRNSLMCLPEADKLEEGLWWYGARSVMSPVSGLGRNFYLGANRDVTPSLPANRNVALYLAANRNVALYLGSSAKMSITSHITFFRGEDITLNFQMTPPVDITGWTITFSIFTDLPSESGTSVFTATATIADGPRGKFTVGIPSANTASQSVGRYVWDCRREDSGNKATLADGYLILRQEVTA